MLNSANTAFYTCNQNIPVWRENYQAFVDETRENGMNKIQNSHFKRLSLQAEQLSKCIKTVVYSKVFFCKNFFFYYHSSIYK